MEDLPRDESRNGRRLHLRHHWQERNRGKDDRWQECRDCGRRRPVSRLAASAYFSGGPTSV